MTISIYLLGVCISAVVWFILIKFRQKGLCIPMPWTRAGNLLDPLNHGNVDYSSLMLGWFLMAVLWPIGWILLLVFYTVDLLLGGIAFVWNHTIGNENLARKIFGGKK